ncbi:Egd2 protein [Martiniozyma asiatica (nom. inval.)]|nr:Egd2 protein [Martiniozyma asiatica]
MSIEEIPQGAEVTVMPKQEKKARDALVKLGLTAVKDITRVTFRKKDGSIIAIEKPDVYKTPSGAYIVFGEAKVEDLTKRYQEAMAAQQAAQQASAGLQQESGEDLATSIQNDLAKASLEDKSAEAEVEDDAEVDATGLEEADISVVMEQSSVSRSKAVKALKENNGDVVNAIMSLA